jgi:hypothetical protein
MLFIIVCKEGHGPSRPTSPTGPPNTVNIAHSPRGKVIIDNQLHPHDINSATKNIGTNENPSDPISEILDILIPLTFGHIRMQYTDFQGQIP